MPYIKQDDRSQYDSLIKQMAEVLTKNMQEKKTNVAGHLNYIITTLMLNTYRDSLPSYTVYNEMIGLLECAKLELYRQQVSDYEDKKLVENGAVNKYLTKK